MDPSARKYTGFSPYNFVLNTPLAAIDPDGKDVYFIIYASDGTDGYKAAATREEQIRNSGSFDPTKDQIYVIEVTDLGKLKTQIAESVADANRNNYGKTVEASFFGHHGSDGPQGTEVTSENNLGDVTGQFASDGQQLSPSGWKDINFNFDTEKSVATFYGCRSSGFAQKFLVYQPDVLAAAGIEGGAGGSSNEFGNFQSDDWTLFSNESYMADQENGEIQPKVLYTRDPSTLLAPDAKSYDSEGNAIPERRAKHYVYGNVKPESIPRGEAKKYAGVNK